MMNKPNFLVSLINRGVILAPENPSDTSKLVCSAASAELVHAGFNVHPEKLHGFSVDELTQIVNTARTASSVNRAWKPLYPNFPKSVKERSDLALLLDQLLYYFTHGEVVPNEDKEDRGALPVADAIVSNKDIEVIHRDELSSIVRGIVHNAVAMSEQDVQLLRGYFEMENISADEVVNLVSGAVNRENISKTLRAAASGDTPVEFASEDVKRLIADAKNADGVLRVMTALYTYPSTTASADTFNDAILSMRDSLAWAVRFRHIPTAVRKAVVKRLGEVSTGEFRADMLVNRRDLWQKLAKSMHSFGYVYTPDAQRALDIIHENIKYSTLASSVEESIESGDKKDAADLLAQHRPSELVRRLSKLVSDVDENTVDYIADKIREVSPRIPLTTLISGYNGIVNYNSDFKVLRVSGALNHAADNTKSLPDDVVDTISSAIRSGIVTKLSSKKFDVPFGVADLDAPVSTMNRDASSTDRVMSRGQRVPVEGFNDKDVVRLFTHWYNEHDGWGTDIDTGVTLFNKAFENVDRCSWNTRLKGETCVHSGDLTNAPRPEGAAEFVDIDILGAEKIGAKYAAFVMNVYSGSAFKDIDVVSGISMRSKMQSGEIFDARASMLAFESHSSARDIIPFIVDLEKGEFIWVDSSMGTSSSYSSMSGMTSLGSFVKSEVPRDTFTYQMLAEAIAESQGGAVDKSETVTKEQLDAVVTELS